VAAGAFDGFLGYVEADITLNEAGVETISAF